VSREPVDALLIGEGFGIGVGTSAEDCDEQMRLRSLAAGAAMNRDRRPRPIDENLLARFVFLAENDVLCATPALVKIAASPLGPGLSPTGRV
jgi:hypothetical protein